MKYDFHAQYNLLSYQKEAVRYLSGQTQKLPAKLSDLATVEDTAARVDLLAQMSVGQKNYARSGLLELSKSGRYNAFLKAQEQNYLSKLNLLPTLPEITYLPDYSFALHFTFTLRKPYISRDDTEFHILDNPVRKDKVFRVPMVGPTAWKGALKAALRESEDNKEKTERLFGKANDETSRRGRLCFYPTFFTQIDMEVINPHSRKTGTGKWPIYFECVPRGSRGMFTLLYVPFDRIGEKESETRGQVAEDLVSVATGVREMMTLYGFGAKTSSGYGVAEENGAGLLKLKGIGETHDSSMIMQRAFANFSEYIDMTKEVCSA